jgi:oligopeptide/dipeptide ABC transporter ATP-binding protein
MSNNLVEVDGVTKVYRGRGGRNNTVALENFSLSIQENEAAFVAIAGESGSGKTTLANLMLGFIHPDRGTISWRGTDIWKMKGEKWMSYRRECQAVFQDPFSVFNPFYKIDHLLFTPINKFRMAASRIEARKMIDQALEVVGLRSTEILGKYPHQVSGGQRQRVMVARAFLLKPKLIVADEPVSMIDASLRAMVLELMKKLKREFNISFLYITHDLSTAYQICDKICILYQGTLVETGDATTVIKDPQHPYTQLLVNSIPVPDPTEKWKGSIDLSLDDVERKELKQEGCKFVDRCPHAMDVCRREFPPLYTLQNGSRVSCYLYKQ